MLARKPKIELSEPCTLPTTTADCVVRVQRIDGMTHVVFAETRPTTGGDSPIERMVCARLAFPNEAAMRIARTIIAGLTTRDWIMSGEENTVDTTH